MTAKVSVPIGTKFGNLITISEPFFVRERQRSFIQVRCICGNEKRVQSRYLRLGRITSCGCTKTQRLTTHAGSFDPLYRTWIGIKVRCYNPKYYDFHRYGGRGIVVCDEWLNNFDAFRKWAAQSGYSKKLTIDRINNDGNYEPSNCQWLSASDNSSKTSRVRYIIAFGEVKNIRKWSQDARCQICYEGLQDRLNKGMLPELAISLPSSRQRST